MTITAERFAQGMTYDQYKAQMTRNREHFERNEQAAQIGEADRRAFARSLRVAVITEDWCGDAVANFPILGRLAQETGTLDVRVFLRDQNLDITDQYLNGEFRSIPVFVFMDESGKELGHWIERPKSVTAERAKRRKEIFASDPRYGSPDKPIADLPEDVRNEVGAKLQKMRDDMAQWANGEVLRELRELVTG